MNERRREAQDADGYDDDSFAAMQALVLIHSTVGESGPKQLSASSSPPPTPLIGAQCQCPLHKNHTVKRIKESGGRACLDFGRADELHLLKTLQQQRRQA